jgi:hypothetical protein
VSDVDVEQRQRVWWRGLNDLEQAQALKVFDQVPAWMVASLENARIAMVEIYVEDDCRVCLMSTRLRGFLDQQTTVPRRDRR